MSDPSTASRLPGTSSREAIRRAARELFAEHGYAGTGVRDIAERAGVSAAVVIKHFGSKDGLFLQTVGLPDVDDGWLHVPVDEMGRALADSILRSERDVLDQFGVFVGASSRSEIAAELKEGPMQDLAEQIAERLEGDDAELRSRTTLAAVAGLLLSVSTLDDPVIAKATHEQLVDHFGRILQAAMTGR